MKKINYILAIAAFFLVGILAVGNVRADGIVGTPFEDDIYKDCIYPGKKGDCFYYVTMGYMGGYYNYKGFAVKRYDLNTNTVRTVYTIDNIQNDIDFYYDSDMLYYIPSDGVMYGNQSDCVVRKINLLNGECTELLELHLEGGTGRSVAVDKNGRIYLSTYFSKMLYVFDANGSELARGENETEIYDIIAVDTVNNNIYYRGYNNWVYWGYDHSMSCLNVARWKSDGTIVFPDENCCITIQFQQYYYEHYSCAEWLGDDCRYIADLSTFAGGNLFLLDSRYINPADVGTGSTTISLLDSGVSVSGVNISNAKATVLAISTRESVYENKLDVTTVGSRAVLSRIGGKDTLLAITGERTVSCVDVASSKLLGTIDAANDIYKIMAIGGKLVLLEKKDAGWVTEVIPLSMPTTITVQGSKTVTVGQTVSYSVKLNGTLQVPCTFTSSNPAILSVTPDGVAGAWAAGTAVITATDRNGNLQGRITVTVKAKETQSSLPRATELVNSGSVVENDSRDNYYSVASYVSAYLTQLSDGSLMKCDIDGNSMYVEYYGLDGKKSKADVTIAGELEYIRGFYAGKDAYYIVCKQSNPNEDDSCEILRVVKYNKSWKRVAACSVYGNNTLYPVNSGSLRMVESNGILYVHTCHTMYTSDDGYNHQANMTFSVKESDMTLYDIYSEVMNVSYGYVSHSFNQFITVRDGYVYRADHGDAGPRGMAVTRIADNGTVSEKVDSYVTFGGFFGSYGENYTGASLGGLEVSSTHAIVVYNQEPAQRSSVRNIKIGAWNLAAGTAEIHDVTDFADGSGIRCNTPKIVKLNSDQFLVMWEEVRAAGGESRTAFVLVDSAGQPTGNIVRVRYSLELSDCQPILLQDGTVAWYVCDGTETRLYDIKPYDMATLKITLQPQDKEVVVEATAKFEVMAAGDGPLTYQWQYKAPTSQEWKNSGQSGNKTGTLSVAAKASLSGYQFRCVVSDTNDQKVISSAVVLTVRPKITSWPKDTTAAPGTTAKFTMAATGKGTLKYQWQYRKNASDTWKTSGQSGNKTATLSVAVTAALNGYQFRCYVTDANGKRSYTNTVTLTVSPRITAQPVNRTATVGSAAEFTVAAEGKGTITYRWQYRKNDTSEWKNSGQSGNKTATLSVATTASLHGYQFRCIVTDGSGLTTESAVATLTVKPKFTTWPKNTTAAPGTKAKFTVAATGKEPLTYQWQYRKNANDTWKTSGQSGNKTATLSVAVTASLNGYQFRCYVTDANGQRSYTNTVTLTVE